MADFHLLQTQTFCECFVLPIYYVWKSMDYKTGEQIIFLPFVLLLLAKPLEPTFRDVHKSDAWL